MKIFGRLSGFFLVTSAMLANKAEQVVRNRRLLVAALQRVQRGLNEAQQGQGWRVFRGIEELKADPKGKGFLDSEMIRDAEEMMRVKEEIASWSTWRNTSRMAVVTCSGWDRSALYSWSSKPLVWASTRRLGLLFREMQYRTLSSAMRARAMASPIPRLVPVI